jgi:hypothetical protein
MKAGCKVLQSKHTMQHMAGHQKRPLCSGLARRLLTSHVYQQTCCTCSCQRASQWPVIPSNAWHWLCNRCCAAHICQHCPPPPLCLLSTSLPLLPPIHLLPLFASCLYLSPSWQPPPPSAPPGRPLLCAACWAAAAPHHRGCQGRQHWPPPGPAWYQSI